jgi:hypothetical protein
MILINWNDLNAKKYLHRIFNKNTWSKLVIIHENQFEYNNLNQIVLQNQLKKQKLWKFNLEKIHLNFYVNKTLFNNLKKHFNSISIVINSMAESFI